MIVVLLLLGVLGEQTVGTGPITAPAESTVTAVKVPTATAAPAPLPIGAYQWPAPFDPADLAPYAMKFDTLLVGAEKIVDVERITMSASGASLGLQVATEDERKPIIGTDGKAVQIWLRGDPAFEYNPAFAGAGVKVGISFLVRTDSDPFKRFERTGVVTVRQQ